MASIPDFCDGYHLPPGEHICTLLEIEQKFLNSPKRKTVWHLFRNFLYRLQSLKINPEVMLIDGSFVTGRENPGDVDVCFYVKSETLDAAINELKDDEDRGAVSLLFNRKNQHSLRLAFGVHPLIVHDEVGLQLYSDLFQNGGKQFGKLRDPDPDRDPGWVRTPNAKGILRVNFTCGGQGGWADAGQC